MTNQELEQTISAAWDGEPVDLDRLRAALQTAVGRETLASYALIRATAAAGDIEPSAEGAARLRASIGAPRRWWLVAGPAVPARLAASLAVVAVATASWVGVTWRPQGPAPSSTTTVAGPTADRGLPATPKEQALSRSAGEQAPAPAPRTPVQSHPGSNAFREAPPTPTRTIQLVVDESGSW